MMIRFLFGPLLVLVFVLSAGALAPPVPAATNTLTLPATPYRYANVECPRISRTRGGTTTIPLPTTR